MDVEVKKRWAGEEVEKRVPLTAFRDAVSELMDGDDRMVMLVGDLSTRTGLPEIEEQYPDRFVNCGDAQRNVIGIAAGMASMGKVPVVLTNGSTVASATDLLRITIGHAGLHVVVAGVPSGLAGVEGTAQHSLDELGALATVPGFRVLAPTDSEETAKGLLTLVDEPGPGYIRLTTEEIPEVTGPDSPFDLGHPAVVREGSGLTLIAHGPLVYEALVAADLLDDAGVDARVLAVHTWSPMDGTVFNQAAAETGAFVVVEEHVPAGGLGAQVAMITSAERPVPIEYLNVGADFVGAAPAPRLRAELALDSQAIVAAAQRVLARKS